MDRWMDEWMDGWLSREKKAVGCEFGNEKGR
jgi:hypothetical protein